MNQKKRGVSAFSDRKNAGFSFLAVRLAENIKAKRALPWAEDDHEAGEGFEIVLVISGKG